MTTTTEGLCHDVVFQRSMGCVDGECDALYGGESLVSPDCHYVLTMEQSGNLALYEANLRGAIS